MRFFSYLTPLLLLAISADGLFLPPGWWCDTRPCYAGMKKTRDSHTKHTEFVNTAVSETSNIKASNKPQARPSQWWCGTRPCNARMKETRDDDIQDTAVANVSINSTTTHNKITDSGPRRKPTNWWCGTRICGSIMKAVKSRQINNTNAISEASTILPSLEVISPGWVCHGRICAPELKLIENRQINETAINKTTTNVTASNNAGHRRIKPTIIWWCSTHVCPTSITAVNKRQIDLAASE